MLEGHLLSERYRIKKTVGGGGMANVYLAHDTILKRDVAIKVLRPEFANDPEFIERFDREAQAATSLSHPNIVNIYDVGEEENILYMVMEYIDGLTLKEYIQEKGPQEVEAAIGIMKQLTDAIAQAHVNGLIHRDIKPQNILVDDYGNVKVTDFGIAIALSATSLTQTNSILGSVHYLSPEQARGGMATKKSDIYSLGIVFYELLTGKLPFSGQSPISIALKHLQDDTPSVRLWNESIPQSVENIVFKAMAKDPFHRYESVYEMEEALGMALDPKYRDEALYAPPQEDGEETKAIPIITDNQLQDGQDAEATLVHKENDNTKKVIPDDAEIAGNKLDKKTKKQKKRFYKRKGFYITLVLILLAAAAAIYYLFSGPKDIAMPDVTDNMSYDEAKDELESLNLQVQKEMMPSEEVKEDYVIKTDPSAGRSVKEKDTIIVFVSNGKEKVAFDDYVGQNFNQVERILGEAGYKEIISYPKTSDRPVGEIISQIQPQEDEDVVPGEQKVIFETSDGPDTFRLTRLTGMSLNEAKEYAEKNGLTLNVKEDYSDSVEKDHIVSQSPDANTDVTEGGKVDVVVSVGPKADPPKSHSVTFTVPYKPEENDDEKEETEEKQEQTVQVYVEDMDNSIDDVLQEDVITSNMEYTLTLIIEPGKNAEYKVVRDGETIIEKSVSYKDGE